MPRGVFKRIKPIWNKGIHNYDLIPLIKQLIAAGDIKLTVGDIYRRLVASGDLVDGRPGYKKLNRQLILARRNGDLDAALIREGRGRTKHQRYHPPSKFNVGDKVRIDRSQDRTPKWLRGELRIDSCRTITAAFHTGLFVSYYLGTNKLNGNSLDVYPFRSGELVLFEKGKVGRPKSKRAYSRQAGVLNYD